MKTILAKNCSLCGNFLEQVFSYKTYPLIISACSASLDIPFFPLVVGTCNYCSHTQLMEMPNKSLLDVVYHGDYTNIILKGTFEKYDLAVLDCKKFLDFSVGDLSAGQKILEIGCFEGEFLGLFNNNRNKLFACEPNPIARVAKEKYGVELIVDYFSAKDFEQGSFDLVIMRHLIEHIEDPLNILKDCRKVLKPNGKILIETPVIECALRNNIIGIFYHQHLQYFSKESLRLVLEMSGFTIISHAFKDFNQFVVAQVSEHDSPEITTSHPKTSTNAVYGTGNAENGGFGTGSNNNYASVIWCLFDSYNERFESFRKSLDRWLNDTHRTIAIYGAGSIATAIVNFNNQLCDKLEFVVDGDPRKQNKVLPAKRKIKVYPPDHLKKEPVEAVLITPECFKDDIIDLLKTEYSGFVKEYVSVHPEFEVTRI